MTRLSADILELAGLLLGDGRADVTITVDGRAQLLPVFREMADRACKLELDLACLEAVAAEIDPIALTAAAADATIAETDAQVARREAREDAARVIRFPVIARPRSAPGEGAPSNGGAA